ncbi:MAG TPA: flagellar basal body L-ring protein FlgH [Lacipirellulaceae bacterium]|jgi:flagellar L-ring protein precursor FlgH|nr:flagellar basal body L-ring protein FlgH [Lacipirellulaceae bacterium]
MNRPKLSLIVKGPLKWARRGVCVVVLVFGETRQQALGQDASLLLSPAVAQQKGPLTLGNASFIYRKLPPEAEQRELQINDIVTVLVDYKSSMLSEGDANAKRTASLNAVLSDWLKFDGKSLMAAPQTHGDPRIAGQLDSQFKTQSDMTLKDSLTFRIAAAVVDIRPNGNLVIEARREIQINDEVWMQSLTGVVRRQSIGADRTVRSDEVAELRIEKKEKGFIRDSYNRGWFTKWYDYWKPF